MMVILHTIMKYMHVLSKRFSHAGQVNWRDDLDLETFWKESCLQDARINFWMQDKN